MKYFIFTLPLSLLAALTACTQRCCDDDSVIRESYIHRYGVEIPKESWSESGRSGQVVSSLSTGVTVMKTYAQGILEGDTTYTFPHSETIEKVESYQGGNLNKVVIYYPSGLPMKEMQRLSPTAESLTWWYENNVPRAVETYENHLLAQGQYYNYDHHLEATIDDGQGERVSRDPYGSLISTDTFKGGQQVSSVTYHSNGSPKEITSYNNGVIEGEKKTFLPTGEPNTIELWMGGEQHGMTRVFQNGERISEVPYVHGVKQGVEKRYRDEKILVEEISWLGGEQDGPSYSYIEGTTITNWFYQGRPVSRVTYEKMTQAR